MDKLIMERVSLETTKACNFNCKLCAADAPYRRAEHDFSLQEQEAVLEKYFSVVSYVKKFTLTGGEPLLYSELSGLILYIAKYLSQIGMVEIITNGSICPSDDLIAACKSLGKQLIFLVDDYGPNLSLQINEIRSRLGQAEIAYIIRNNKPEDSHCGGWVDYGDPRQQINFSSRDMETVFSKCAIAQKLKFNFNVYYGIMYPCEQVRRCVQFGSTPNYQNECVDLLDDTTTIAELREKIQNIYRLKSLSACAFCKGMCDDSERFPPAEQLTEKELECIRKGAQSYYEMKQMMEHIQ